MFLLSVLSLGLALKLPSSGWKLTDWKFLHLQQNEWVKSKKLLGVKFDQHLKFGQYFMDVIK